MSSIPCTDTIASSPKTGEVDLHMTLAVMSDTENTFISGIKAEKDEEEEVPRLPKKCGKKTTNANGGEDGSPTEKIKKVPSKKTGTLGPIPTTLDEASDEDKMIIRMKEVESKPWAYIRKALEDITGGKIGASTLQIRYTRMKANFVVFDEVDEPRMFQAKKEIEERFETEKWQKIADWIEANGGSKYPPATVQKKFKALTKKPNEHGAAVTTTMGGK